MKANFKKDGEETAIEGTYKVEKNTFVMTMKRGDEDRSQTITITRITDNEMVTTSEDGKVVELKKK